jgi:hypothetical protein
VELAELQLLIALIFVFLQGQLLFESYLFVLGPSWIITPSMLWHSSLQFSTFKH